MEGGLTWAFDRSMFWPLNEALGCLGSRDLRAFDQAGHPDAGFRKFRVKAGLVSANGAEAPTSGNQETLKSEALKKPNSQ